jgi:hypothetical protein
MTTLSSATDCLVLKIEEYVDNTLDTTLFVLYDKNEETYLIRGKRSDINGKEPINYSFSCYYTEELNEFISFVLCPKSKISYSLFNYDDLPSDPCEIDYNYLKDLDDDKMYEIAGYDNQKIDKKKLLPILKFLKYVFNYY